MADLRVDIASVFSGAKAFKQADTATQSLEKGVLKLGKTLVATFGATKVLQFAKSSAKAFLEDEAAATKLAQSINNLGLAYANNDIRKFVDSLTLASGVADDELRPALQALLQVTGSVTKSQAMLSQAIDISRGSGFDLTTVANDLSQAYVGNLRGLRKYNLGLTKAELAASSFVDIQDRLNTLFGGASTAFLKTYAGQMQLLTNSANEAKEVIGKSLVEALAALGKDDSVANLATDMQNVAQYTADVVTGIGAIIDEVVNRVPQGGLLQKLFGTLPLATQSLLKGVFGITDILAGVGQSTTAKKGAFNFGVGGGAGVSDAARVNAAAAKKAEDAAKKRAKELLALTAKQTKAIKEQTALQKAGTLFDLEQTQVIAALKGNISADERKRLELQLALLTGNTTEASILAGKLAYSQGLTKELVAYFKNLPDAKNPFAGWKSYLDAIEAQVLKIAKGGTGGGGGTVTVPIVPKSLNEGGLGLIPGSTQVGFGDFGDGGAVGAPITVIVSIDGQEITDAVTKVQTNNSLSGRQIAVNRRTGTFATI